MNSFGLNSAVLDGLSSYAQIVFLPSSTVSFEVQPSERTAVTLSGGVFASMHPTGDIYRVGNLGVAQLGVSLEVTGLLAAGELVGYADGAFELSGDLTLTGYFGYQNLDCPVDLTGTLGAVQYLSGSAGLSSEVYAALTQGVANYLGETPITSGLDAVGSLRLFGGLSGDATNGLDPDGYLSVGLVTAIPYADAGYGFYTNGAISMRGGLSGDAVTGFSLSGVIGNIVAMNGSVDSTADCYGALSNNAFGQDISDYLMTRPYQERSMVRQ